jgi:hypothetical protein
VVIMGCGHEDAMPTLKKRFENRRSGGQCVSPTKTIHVFSCGESELCAFSADPKGHILPSRIYPRVRWRFERRLTLRLDRNSPMGKIVRATLDAIAKHGFQLTHAAVNAELLAFTRTCTAVVGRRKPGKPGKPSSPCQIPLELSAKPFDSQPK